MKTTIRVYQPSDKFSCIDSFKSNVPKYFTEEEILEYENFLDAIEKENTRTVYYVLLYYDKVIGCGGFGEKDNAGIISLAWGLVHNQYHKTGLGKKLLQHRIEQIKILKPKFPVVIDTTQHTFGFFEKFGFVTTKITNDYYTVGLHRYDMTLHL